MKEKCKTKWDDFEEGKEVLEKGTGEGRRSTFWGRPPQCTKKPGKKTKPQGGVTFPILSQFPSLQAKKKILSILSKTPCASSSPCEKKPLAHPCAKGDTPRTSTGTTHYTNNPNAHTTHATN